MSNRGYCTERVAVGKTAFSRTPTPLQKASYHGYLIETIKKGEIDLFRRLMASGLSPNPSNMYGESLCHLVCRLGDHRMLKVMLDCGATTEVCDDFGRTPLHDACWAAKPAFELVDLIMTAGLPNGNHYLFSLTDNRGATPLSYIRQEHWAEWMEFLVKKKDIYWPAMDKSHGKKGPPDITRELPNSRPLPDPMGALPLELANMVASGSILPEEAILLSEEDSTSWSDENKGDSDYLDELDMVRFISNFGDDSDSSSDFEESDNSDCDDDEDEDEDFSEEALCAMFQITKESKERRELSAHDSSDTLKEMAQVLTCLKMSGRQPIVWSS